MTTGKKGSSEASLSGKPASAETREASGLPRRRFIELAGTAGVALASGLLTSRCRTEPVSDFPAPDPTEKELALLALDEARAAGAEYADVRISQHRFEGVGTREERITSATRTESYGVGVRALVGGSWGFAASGEVSRSAVGRIARLAAATAKANNQVAPSRVELAPVEVYPDARWVTPHQIDPFDIPLEEKAELLFSANRRALAVKGASFVSSSLFAVNERRLLATSEGSVVYQTLIRINPDLRVTAVSSDRSDFQSRGAVVQPAGRGWEYVLELDLPGNAERWAEEAVAKLSAHSVEEGDWDLVLAPSNLWLTIHEAIGHPTELDRALGYEANYAGTSFLAPPDQVLNRFRLGPEFMNFVGNRDERAGCATVGWDDEAVPATAWPIVKDGLFVNYQTTREQASWISEKTGVERSLGCAHAQNWAGISFQRMPNVSLMPGEEELGRDEVLGAVERGIFIEGDGSYSIDQQRYNAQFGGQVFWEIRGGKKHRMLRDVAYVVRTPDFWNSLALLGGPSTYELGASFGDAKGQPGQSNAVSHGCPVALFKNVKIINTA